MLATFRHDKQTKVQHYNAADRRPTNQVSAWQAERGSRSTRALIINSFAMLEFVAVLLLLFFGPPAQSGRHEN